MKVRKLVTTCEFGDCPTRMYRVHIEYDETGAFLGPDFLPEENAAEFIQYRDTGLAHAEPFSSWWAKHGG